MYNLNVFILLHSLNNAKVAQLVERNLAKVEVASSSLVFRSIINSLFLLREKKLIGPGGGIGRHAGLKILYPLKMCGFKSRPGYIPKSLKTLVFSGFVFLKNWEVAAISFFNFNFISFT